MPKSNIMPVPGYVFHCQLHLSTATLEQKVQHQALPGIPNCVYKCPQENKNTIKLILHKL